MRQIRGIMRLSEDNIKEGDMELIVLNKELKKKYSNDILMLMKLCDNDFVPPMSKRFSPFQSELGHSENESESGILHYHSAMMNESVICIVENGTLLGFVTYVENYINQTVITDKDLPNIYVCTLIVNPSARGRGLTMVMYDHLFYEKYTDRNLFTRTWSTNRAHISILKKYGFHEIHRIENDRGEGIDTVYFGKRR